ncbi:Rap/Ran GTPase-activating protein, putative [Entamoeba histolytica HM-1:IMSS-B]|uniref:Rap/Ran GTPase-activating protein, putative n=4 Tax=Entamoeba histolytica TaxID=5759 RepID=C4LWC0_ENTH1|nr:Rap/Ran GTPase-activating protein, putative [Entamoeba histolytica HM-1:IMSS]EAL50382.1 Rap/Ran GTPase-activating protein, putative [Entamoeba histolytica HM-1:IMSS]EMH78291.1 Rap/Ran GTPase-activating protein, putative [Entamoeba histolytica HM-1:IMSS-B]ENY64041.1 Rap/Ran GTPase-activating protein, putative [Entamoeba histolytica HM-1:IMSS-A]GAT93002.1 rap ran GTPase-activating protein putative [Entamoeba histolytica]|eukprot:XP_655768.1 Rap/Ran GTPase-activating protein, putative [Entamoeba histolytica HM-1:IMSS]
MSTELDKKIRKKQTQLYDNKESVSNRIKACITLSEKMNPDEFYLFIKRDKQGFAGFIIEITQYVQNHTKKGKISVSVKDAINHIKILNIMTSIYQLNELTVFDLYQKFLFNYLKIETHPEVREAAFNFVIDCVFKYGEQEQLTDMFMKTINIGQLFNKSTDFPVIKLDYAESSYCPAETDIDQYSMTIKLITSFLKLVKVPSNFDKLFFLVEVMLSYLYPNFAEEAQYKYKLNHPNIGKKDELPPASLDKFVLDSFKDLMSSPIAERLKTRPAFVLFIKHFYIYVLQITPEDLTHAVIIATIQYFTDFFILNPSTSQPKDVLSELQRYLIESITTLFDKPFVIGNQSVSKILIEEIKNQIIKLASTTLNDEIKQIIIETVLNCIDILVKTNFGNSIGSFVDLIFILYIKWERTNDDWVQLRTRLSNHYNVSFVMDQIALKLRHCTRLVLKDFYSPLLLENTDEVIVGTKKVARSTHLDFPDEIFVAPSLDDKFSYHFPNLGGESALKLWYYFYSLLSDINEHPKDDIYENGIKLLYEIFCLFIRAETKVYQFYETINLKRICLVDDFGKIFFDAFKRRNHTSLSLQLCYRAICRLVNRHYVRFTNELYSLFYETISIGLPMMPSIILEELYDIIYNQIPGWPALLIPFIQQLSSLKKEQLQETNNVNRDAQIIALLNSLVTVEENYPTLLQDISKYNKEESLTGSYSDAITNCFENLLKVFTSTKSQVSLVYGMATHIIFSRRNSMEISISPILTSIIERISNENEELFRPSAEVIGELASFTEYFTISDVQDLLSQLIEVILNPQSKTEAIACIFTSLIDWAFSPSCIFPKALTPELTVNLLNSISYSMSLPYSVKSNDPNIKYRACAPECAEVFLQTLLNAFGFVPSEKGSDKFFSTHIEEGEVTWWAYGNNILSIEKGNEGEFCNLIIRNAVGKTVWGVKSISLLEELGIKNTKQKTRLTVKDIVQTAPKQIVNERTIREGENKLKNMINEILKEENDLLEWGMPDGVVERADYDKDLSFVKDSVDNVEKQIKELGMNMVPPNKNVINLNNQPIDNTKLLIHSLLCQTQFIDPMPKNNISLIPINPTEKFKILLGNLDKSCVRPFHKIGLIYVKNGQHDQYDILMNQEGSPAYKEFVEGLGWTLDIKTHSGFLGGLDKTYLSTGEYIRYYADATKEVIFHDITLIPTQADDQQQLTKKRHVGNDYVHIVWNESGDYNPHTITSQFNAAHIIVTPIGNGLHKIRIWRKQNVRQFGPLMDGIIVGKEVLPALVRETAINANYCCSLNISPDDYLKPYLRRTTLIKEIIDKNDSFPTPTFFSTLSIVTNPQTINDLAIKK